MIRRFVIEAIVLSILGSLVWWATRNYTAATTIAGAKGLHWLIGYPSPFLAGNTHYIYWFSPLFPPMAGLILASRWLSWRRRLIGLVIGLGAFWYLVSLQVAVAFSPYLTLSTVRGYLSQILIALNSVAVPIVLWLIVTGGPPVQKTRPGKAGVGRVVPAVSDRRAGTARPAWLVSVVLALFFCAVATLPVELAVEQSSPSLDAARKRVANAILVQDYSGAADAIDAMLQQQDGNRYLSHLQSELRRLPDQPTSGL